MVGKRQKSEDIPTDVALQMAPLTDSRIIYENIAPGNGSTVLPCRKYGKFGSRGPFCRRSLAIFSPFHPRGREETGGKKRNGSGKIGNGSTFLADENSRLTHSLLFTTPSPFRYHLLSPKASLYCNLVV